MGAVANSYADERQRRYNAKVGANNEFDSKVKSAQFTMSNTPATVDPAMFDGIGSAFDPCNIHDATLTDPTEYSNHNHANGSVFEMELDGFTVADKVALLLRYYNPVKYRGAIFPTNGENPYTLDSMKCKREDNLIEVQTGNQTIYDRKDDGYNTLPSGRKFHARKAVPFNLNYALKNHVSMGDNVGIYFYQAKCKMVAFDFDSDSGSSIAIPK